MFKVPPQLRFFLEGRKRHLTFGYASIIILLFAYFNSGALFGEFAVTAEGVIQKYLILGVIAMGMFHITPDLFTQDIRSGLKDFAIFAGVFFIATLALPTLFKGVHLTPLAITPNSLAYTFIIFFAVAIIETIAFQVVLAKRLPYGNLIAPFLFGVFHIYAMDFNWIFVGVAIAIGFIFQIIKDRFGADATAGSHYGLDVGIRLLSG